MPTLSTSLINNQVASARDVEEALARQVMYGGDLATNLLELAAVSETTLAELVARDFALDPAPAAELPRAEPSTLRLVPGDLAWRYGLYPLSEQHGELVVAVAEPLAPEVEQDLGFALGVRIVQRAALLVRVRQAIARDYNLTLDRRSSRIIAKLSGAPDPLPSSAPDRNSTAVVPQLPLPDSLPPPDAQRSGVPAAPTRNEIASPAPTATSSPPRRELQSGSASPLNRFLEPVRRPSAQRRVGPYTVAMAERDLLRATTRNELVHALFDFASQYFDYTALFAVHGDLAEGLEAHGPGAGRARVNAIGVPLDLPSSLAAARDQGTWQLLRLASAGIDGALLKDLERKPGPAVLLLPLTLRGRCVMILYGDHGDADVELERIGDVISFAPLVGAALERVILLRKKKTRLDVQPLPVADKPEHPELPNRRDRASALASALAIDTPARGPTSPAPPAAKVEASRPPAGPEEPPPARTPAPPSYGHIARPHRPPAPRPATARPAPTVSGSTPSTEPSFAPAPRLEELELERSVRPHPVVSIGPDQSAAPSSVPPSIVPLSRPLGVGSREEEPPEDGWDVAPRTAVSGARLELSELDALPQPAAAEASGTATPGPAQAEAPRAATPRPAEAESGIATRPAVPDAAYSGTGEALDVGTPRLELVDEATAESAYEAVRDSELESEDEPAQDDASAEPGDASEASVSSDGPQIDASVLSMDDEIAEALARENEAPLAPASRAVAFGARALVPRQTSEEHRLPSVIVSLEADSRELVRSLCDGDAEAEQRLADLGATAIPALVASFPGPLSADTRAVLDGTRRAGDSGPILRTLTRIGLQAVPFLVVRTADSDPHVRTWSTRLLGELPSVEGARAVARRLLDGDDQVRRAAVTATRLLREDLEARKVIRDELTDLLLDSGRSTEARMSVIEAFADVRDVEAVPTLIRCVRERNPDIVRAARWALTVLSRQDFSEEADAWTDWYKANASHHRVEWLIDALMHQNQDIRRSAGDELKSLTKEYFGYYDDLPPRERAAAQSRYREWWERSGRLRFR